ncbi:protein MpGEBP4 [Marchantia polymorpha subsp. ruderalis]|nr:hypothetical protein MARPO_0168s0004 [Marchantia polymorpha]BBN03664.1 hypothetical protein Mp_2g25290 [Marchantia polymorpha subsp. ruderalis]|eukprot:PTQ28277.1 hypothetical protein MARPO_0168s0004 [Marchantia polymorpha]
MGRIQEQSETRMRGQQQQQGQRASAADAPTSPLVIKSKRKLNEGDKSMKSPGLIDNTPGRDRKNWSAGEEMDLVKVLLDHRKEGRVIPLQSKTATYWTELITILYPGEGGVTQRRLYDKVRRMQHKFNESKHLLEEKKANWRNPHERTLFEYWEKIFLDGSDGSAARASDPKQKSANQQQHAHHQQPQQKATNGNAVKVVQVSDSSSSEEDDDHDEEMIPPAANAIRKPGPTAPAPGAAAAPPAAPMEQTSESEGDEEEEEEEEEDDDEGSPEKKRAVPSSNPGSRVEAIGVSAEELRKTSSPGKDGSKPKAAGKLISKLSGGMARKEAGKTPVPNGEKGRARTEDEAVEALKAELFQYVQDLRNDCMQQLDEVRNQLISPARMKLARRRQELILEELSLQEKELEISRRYCRLQKEALKLQTSA